MNEKYDEAKLQEAIYLAVDAHSGQKDKAGVPYICHAMAVMALARNNTERIVAVLHDVVEDSDISIADIRFRFGDEIAWSVDALTKREGERYYDFIRRAKENPTARRVKWYDITHNMDRNRIKNPVQRDFDRWRKYEKALDILAGFGD